MTRHRGKIFIHEYERITYKRISAQELCNLIGDNIVQEDGAWLVQILVVCKKGLQKISQRAWEL